MKKSIIVKDYVIVLSCKDGKSQTFTSAQAMMVNNRPMTKGQRKESYQIIQDIFNGAYDDQLFPVTNVRKNGTIVPNKYDYPLHVGDIIKVKVYEQGDHGGTNRGEHQGTVFYNTAICAYMLSTSEGNIPLNLSKKSEDDFQIIKKWDKYNI